MTPRLALSAAALLAALAATGARAADLAPENPYYQQSVSPAVYDWTGFYAGAHLGYGKGSAGSTDIGGVLGGVHGGYNIQAGAFVMGLEADLDATGMDRHKASSQSLDWLGSARARVGFAYEQALIYGTGGFGFGYLDYSNGVSRDRQWNPGWVLGVGAEVALARNWTARVEAFRYDLGRSDYLVFGGPVSVSLTATTVRGGISYRF